MRLVLALALGLAPVLAGAADGPDYVQAESWLARPGIDSPALLLPGGEPAPPDTGLAADVFYIHPTTAMTDDPVNVPTDDEAALAMARIMLEAQATPFNTIARIYAPRYRQAALGVFALDEDAVQAPMNLAYDDLRRAFRHYLAQDNGGRPFFLVGHSQGSYHALRLLAEEIAGSPQAGLLVAAYIPGMPVPRMLFDSALATLPPCAEPLQTGCIAPWQTFAETHEAVALLASDDLFWDATSGRWRTAPGMALVNVNPISWRLDGVAVPASAHLGAVPFGVRGSHFARIVPQLVGAQVVDGNTLVTPVPADLFDDGGMFGAGNYHVFDISLFWADIRANAAARLAAWLAAHPPDG